jgi:DNA-binding CsgD family transcriptional regulator
MGYGLYKKLTKRQLEIADCAKRGFTDGKTANAFNISIHTEFTYF